MIQIYYMNVPILITVLLLLSFLLLNKVQTFRLISMIFVYSCYRTYMYMDRNIYIYIYITAVVFESAHENRPAAHNFR